MTSADNSWGNDPIEDSERYVAPAVQADREREGLEIVRAELRDSTDPQTQAALKREIARREKAYPSAAGGATAPPATAESWGDDPVDESWGTDPVEEPGLIDRGINEAKRLGSALSSGVDQFKAGISGLRTGLLASGVQQKTENIRTAEAAGDTATAARLRAEQPGRQQKLGEVAAGAVADNAALAKSNTATTTAAMKAMNEAKTFGEAWEAFKVAPYEISSTITAQSLPTMIPALIVGAIMGPAPGALAMGVSSGATEAGSALTEFAQESGIDVTSKDALLEFYNDPAVLAEGLKRAGVRGGIIGGLDAASAGAASKIMAPAKASPLVRQAINLPAQAVTQAVAGGGGEAAVQYVEHGEIRQPGAVVGEIVGDAVTAPLDVAAFGRDARRLHAEGQRALATGDVAAAARVANTQAGALSAAAGLTPIVTPEAPAAKPSEDDAYARAGNALDTLSRAAGEKRSGASPYGVGGDGLLAGEPAVADVGNPGAAPGQDGVDVAAGRQDERSGSADVSLKAQADADVSPTAQTQSGNDRTQPGNVAASAPIEAEKATPTESWLGRKGQGFTTEKDAEQARVGRSQRSPDLEWRTEPRAEGGFAVNGYARTAIDTRAAETATSPTNDRPEPTEAQKAAGNYKKGHLRLGGMDISIENDHGSTRRGVDPDGKAWESTVDGHYGYIKGTEGADGDHVDIGIKPGTPDDHEGSVFIIDQVDPKTGKFDEHKVRVGYGSAVEAMEAYKRNYADGWTGGAAITEMPLAQFKVWAKAGVKTRPVGDITGFTPTTKETTNVQAEVPGGGVRAGDGANRGGVGDVQSAVALRGADAAQRAGGVEVAAEAAPEFAGGEAGPVEGSDQLSVNVERDFSRVANTRSQAPYNEKGVKLARVPTSLVPDGKLLEALGAVLGNHVIFFKDAGPESGMGGWRSQNRLYVKTTGNKDAALAIVMHEVIHNLDPDLKAALIKAIIATVSDAQRASFRFNYGGYFARGGTKLEDEEIVAFLSQGHAKTAAFWKSLAEKTDQSLFKSLAEHILSVLDRLISAISEHGDLTRFSKDVKGVREALTTALAEQAKRKGGVDAMADSKSDEFSDAATRGHEYEVSTRAPWGKTATEDPVTGMLSVGIDAAVASGKAFEKNVALVTAYPNFRDTKSADTPAKQAERFIAHVQSNLLWLYDQVPAEIRERSHLWYDGANKIAKRLADQYDLTEQQIAGVMATLSPQKDWFMNVSLGQRVIDIMRTKRNEPWDQAMSNTADRILGKPQYADDLAAIRGKRLADLQHPVLKAMWLRVFDEAHNTRQYDVVMPEGDSAGLARNLNGSPSRVAWGDFGSIAKAIAIIEDGSLRNISTRLGSEHKVRSFYNNILVPGSENGHVTIDTHAVAAALLRPLSGSAVEVLHNFGGNGAASSAVHGMSGTYGLYAEAYRRAAKERGVLPREMQSITWEAVRGLFTPGFKSQQKNVDESNHIWDTFKNGRISLDQARTRILEAAGGIEEPAWFRPSAGSPAQEGAGDARVVPGVRVPGGRAKPAARGARGAAPAAAPDQFSDSVALGTLVNIGLDTNDGKGITASQAITMLMEQGVEVLEHAEHTSSTEPTLVAKLSRPLTPAQATAVSAALDQEAIAQFTGGAGKLYGPSASKWGDFNPEFFMTLDGKRLGDTPADAGRPGDQADAGDVGSAEGLVAGGTDQQRAGAADPARVALVHYGRVAGLSSLAGAFNGTGIRGAEQERLSRATDPRIKKRSYFYLADSATDLPAPEAGLGQHVYRTTAAGLYDRTLVNKAEANRVKALQKTPDENGFESAVIDAGYKGYINREQGTAVVFGDSVPVAYDGPIGSRKPRARKIERLVAKTETRTEGSELVRRPTAAELTGIVKARPALSKAAPSFKLEFGEARVAIAEQGAADKALESAGADFRFGDDNFSDTPEGVSIVEVTGGFNAMLDGKRVGTLRDNLERGQAKQLGEFANVSSVEVDKSVRGTGVGSALYRAFYAKHEGRILPSGQTSSMAWKLWKRNYPAKVDQFVKMEAERLSDGADPALVLRNITDPEIAKRVREAAVEMEAIFSDNKRDDVSPIGFYSVLARKLADGPGKAMPEQWRAYVKGLTTKGVKADEIEWTGLTNWLAMQTGKVDKSDVLAFVKANGVQVTETVLGTESFDGLSADETQELIELRDLADRAADIANEGDSEEADALYGVDDEERQMELENRVIGGNAAGVAEYGTYVLPGGENYREVLLTLPVNRDVMKAIEAVESKVNALADQGLNLADLDPADPRRVEIDALRAKRDATPLQEFKSNHWTQKNILAHIRVNDRTDAGGKRVLFIEEIQSDWAQKGKKKGFRDDAKIARLREELEVARARDEEAYKAILRDSEKMSNDDYLARLQANKLVEEEVERLALLVDETTLASQVPQAPFVGKTDAWVALALKRVVKMAVDGGYDRVAMVTGEQSAARYELSRQIDAIDYRRMRDGAEFDIQLIKGGNLLAANTVKAGDLADHVGKEMAAKLVAGEGKLQPARGGGFEMMRLDGLDLQVGGEGMKAFYDKIVPNVLKDVLRKLGGAPASVTINTVGSRYGVHGRNVVDLQANIGRDIVSTHGSRDNAFKALAKMSFTEQPGFDITPEMREAAGEGLPMFSDNAPKNSSDQFAFNLGSIRRPAPRTPGLATDGWILSRDEMGRFRFGAGAKLYRKIALLANAVLDVIRMKPMSPELRRAMRVMKNEVNKAMTLTAEAATAMSELSVDEREMLSDVIEQELRAGVTPPQKILDLAATISALMSQQSDDLVAVGMLSPEAADKWRDKYLPRFYAPKLGTTAKTAWDKAKKMLTSKPKAMTGIGGSSLKRRGMTEVIEADALPEYEAQGWVVDDRFYTPGLSQTVQVHRDFSRPERESMGEIRDAMFRFTMGYMRSQKDLALGRLYQHLADTIASNHELEGYVRVPDTKIEGTGGDDFTAVNSYGKLGGKWVPREVLDHLSKFGESEYEAIIKFYRKGLSMWKEGKTVLNPVSHMNNVVSNMTMAHFAGVSYWDAHKHVGVIQDFFGKAPMIAEAREAGLFGGTVTQEELNGMLPKEMQVLAQMEKGSVAKGVDFTWNVLSLFLRKPMGMAYDAEDMYFRYLIYRDARGRGLHPNDAVDYSQRFIFSYDDLPKGARIVRDTVLPFFSYTYKVVPVLAGTLLQYPWRYAAPALALHALNTAMYAIAAGDDDDEWYDQIADYVTAKWQGRDTAADRLQDSERRNLPPWMKGNGFMLGTPKAIRLSMDDVTGLPVFMDVSRFFPGGDLLDVHANAGGVPMLQPLTPSTPLLGVYSAMFTNKDPYFGKDIVDKNDTSAEAGHKRSAWLWNQFAPAIAVGNYHFNRTADAIASAAGKSIPWWPLDYTGIGKDGLPVQPKYAIAQTLGIKARPVDLDLSQKIDGNMKRKLIADMKAEIKSLQRLQQKGALTFDQAQDKIDRNRTKIGNLRQGLDVEGDETE
jgi:GNAT superfamily N-acetyltransferase